MQTSVVRTFFLSLTISFAVANSGLGQAGVVEDAEVLERAIVRQAVPADVLADAVKEVQQVGDLTLKGDFMGVVDKLYPRYRHRAAKKLGGNEEMAATMKKMVDDLAASGITITKFVAEPALHGFDIPEFREWLVFVPTTRLVRRIDPATGLVERMEIKDYQVAIRKKTEGSSWSFLNGSTLNMQELRALFPTLPADIEEFAVPEKGARRVK
ncbi:hypothetical protein GCM10007100_12330 [Roseibacillus persicicus]|uniref:DUF302 domain-containing protein n=1 Tax=Roseibacillus persicicus TaxID=454148 RepID=A0A918THP2_9BACT|nr:hypothetical protein GCM10007100_12330 [Roseibacillus persicicus]